MFRYKIYVYEFQAAIKELCDMVSVLSRQEYGCGGWTHADKIREMLKQSNLIPLHKAMKHAKVVEWNLKCEASQSRNLGDILSGGKFFANNRLYALKLLEISDVATKPSMDIHLEWIAALQKDYKQNQNISHLKMMQGYVFVDSPCKLPEIFDRCLVFTNIACAKNVTEEYKRWKNGEFESVVSKIKNSCTFIETTFIH